MKLPNFFIIGAPRCGTTAMAKFLAEHPRIYIPRLKEPKYYCHDLRHRVVESKSAYERLFTDAGPAHIAVGEASTSYAYSSVAVSEIVLENPDARFVFMVRDPVKAAASLHAHLCSLGVESIRDFRKAWHLQEKRAKGLFIPSGCNDRKRLLYGEIYLYGRQVERIEGVVNPEQLLIVFHEDLIADPRAEYLRILKHLRVPDDGREVFEKVHALERARFPSIARMMRIARAAAKRIGLLSSIGVGARVARMNRKPVNKLVIPRVVEREVRAYFDADIETLSARTGRNLNHWRISV